ncbi:MAG: hypothetical protein L0Y70_09305 [Gemmataceae bacterium]|nr:hypothetical protein [Gemmataceae bacterium]
MNRLFCVGVVVFAAAVFTSGCGGSSVTVYPFKGKVVYKGKGIVRQLAGTLIRLQSTSDAKLTPMGTIEDDGSFTIGTIIDQKDLPGVPAGQYKARLEPLDDDDGNPRLNLFHRKYLEFEKSGLSYTVPVSGEITIELER